MIQAGIFVFPRVEELDFVGPFETLSAANTLAPGSIDVKLIASEHVEYPFRPDQDREF